MGLHYSKVDAALSGKIDPTTLSACLYYTFSTDGSLKVFQQTLFKILDQYLHQFLFSYWKMASYKCGNVTGNLITACTEVWRIIHDICHVTVSGD